MAGDNVLLAAIFPQRVWLECLQHLKQGLFLAGLGQELGDAINLLGHVVLLIGVAQALSVTTRLSMRRALPR